MRYFRTGDDPVHRHVGHAHVLAAHHDGRDDHHDQSDKLRVQILNSSGTLLSTLATNSNLNASASYAQKSFDVTSFKGQTIRVRFNGTEDSSLQTSFLVDDTALNVQ